MKFNETISKLDQTSEEVPTVVKLVIIKKEWMFNRYYYLMVD